MTTRSICCRLSTPASAALALSTAQWTSLVLVAVAVVGGAVTLVLRSRFAAAVAAAASGAHHVFLEDAFPARAVVGSDRRPRLRNAMTAGRRAAWKLSRDPAIR